MKKILLLLLTTFCLQGFGRKLPIPFPTEISGFFTALNPVLSTGPDEIIGIWLNSSGKGQIQVYKEGDKYYGKIIWLREPNGPRGNPKLDANNPDRSLQSQPLVGLVILRGFKFDDGEWNSGKVYDPENGKDYKCYLKLKDAKTLNVRGYIGISLLGRTEVWTRVR
ncbi:MAG: hypothetical protein RLZZ28_692 [Bacteroidota bacterium]|jgi:uncharacterized protein (DUF2147 family)